MFKDELIKRLTITGVGLAVSFAMQVAVRRLITKFMEGKLPNLLDVDEDLENNEKSSALKAFVIVVATEMGIVLTATAVAIIVQYMISQHWPVPDVDLNNQS